MLKKLCRKFSSPLEVEHHFATMDASQSSQSKPNIPVETPLFMVPETSLVSQPDPPLLSELFQPPLFYSTSASSPTAPTEPLNGVSAIRSLYENALNHLQVKEQLLVS